MRYIVIVYNQLFSLVSMKLTVRFILVVLVAHDSLCCNSPISNFTGKESDVCRDFYLPAKEHYTKHHSVLKTEKVGHEMLFKLADFVWFPVSITLNSNLTEEV